MLVLAEVNFRFGHCNYTSNGFIGPICCCGNVAADALMKIG